jgi:hypothetical protein
MSLNIEQLKKNVLEAEKQASQRKEEYRGRIQTKIDWFKEYINSNKFEELLQEKLERSIEYNDGDMYLTITIPSENRNYVVTTQIFAIDNYGYAHREDCDWTKKPVTIATICDFEKKDILYITNEFYDLFAKRLDELGLRITSTKPHFQLKDKSTNTYEIYIKIK